MKPRILLVNPPICDFAAYDFWLKPYGLLRVGGMISSAADVVLFDYLDRGSDDRKDKWGRGSFRKQRIEKPAALKDIPRHFRRFGCDRESFTETQDRFLDRTPKVLQIHH